MSRRSRYSKVHYNLRLYLTEAVLPTMGLAEGAPPVPQHTKAPPTAFLLSPLADSRRKLRNIFYLEKDDIRGRIQHFISTKIPNRPIRMPGHHAVNDAELLLPAISFLTHFEEPPRVKDMPGFSEWVEIPLVTAERVVQMIWPEECKGLSLTIQCSDAELPAVDAYLYRTYYWMQNELDPEDVHQSSCKVIFAAVAPWALAPKDMTEFSTIKRFPAFTIKRDENNKIDVGCDALERSHKIWAKLWDDCTRRRCPYFVISVYHCWMFGVFTRGWTTAIVSERILHTDARPSVLQWLVFWISAATGIPGSWSPPDLSTYKNPDVTDDFNVALKLVSRLDDSDKLTDSEWLEKQHRFEGEGQSSRMTKLLNMTRTWRLRFT